MVIAQMEFRDPFSPSQKTITCVVHDINHLAPAMPPAEQTPSLFIFIF